MDIQEKSMSSKIDQAIEAADDTFPGAVLLVSASGEVLHYKAYGLAQRFPEQRPMSVDTIFDLASLTKVLATVPAVMSLIESGKMSLEDRIATHIPEYTGDWRDRLAISDLLVHGSGLPAWRPFFEDVIAAHAQGGPPPGSREARQAVFSAVRASPQAHPRGESAIYSDLGIILLTEAIERTSGTELNRFCDAHIYRYLDLSNLFFLPLDEEKPPHERPESSFAATEFNARLGRYLVGEVHDDNAHVMGGVSGHAGLFGTAADVHAIALNMLEAYHGVRGRVFGQDTVHDFWRRRVFPNGSMRAYGWDVPTQEGSSAGRYFSGLSVGHLGFTGTSIWIDVAREVIVVLLTNRVHPSRDNEKIKQFRPVLHDLVMEKIVADCYSPPGTRTSNITRKPEPLDEGDETYLEKSQLGMVPQFIPSTYSGGEPGVDLPSGTRKPHSGVWFKCKNCREIAYRPDFEQNLNVCTKCNFHHYLPVNRRVGMLLDEGSFQELDATIAPKDPLLFKDSKAYKDRLKTVQKKLGVKDAFVYGHGTMDGRPVHIGVFDFSFMGGSMGSVVGEKVTRLFERALEAKSGAILVSASGGARMQEGVLSLMQMAKSCAALSRLKDAGLPYISIMCHPTTGGVAASFSMLGDVNIAEPEALIGFAGPRVIEQTIRQKLPEGFQRAEYLLEHGMLDMIVERKDMRRVVSDIYGMLFD